jgi:glycosyltransferase involved in cell wall biosynthesis
MCLARGKHNPNMLTIKSPTITSTRKINSAIMKILYLTHTVTWKGGGIFFTAFHQGRYLARRGHEVTLLSISPHSRFRFSETIVDGVKIVETPDLLPGLARTGWDLWDVLGRILYLRDKKFDIIHGFESRPVVSLPAFFTKKNLGVPLILTWADWFGKGGRSEERSRPIRIFMTPVEDFCEKYFYPKADFVIAMGKPLADKAAGMGIAKEKILILLHGCDTERLTAIPQETAKLRLGQKLPGNIKTLGYLGYLWSVNADLLFQTVRLVKKTIHQPFKLVLIGNHRVNLTKLLPDDLKSDVIETGWISYEDVNLYLCASDVLILPLKRTSVSDNIWPSKLNDYLASGRPIVATNMQILKTIYPKSNFGYLTEDTPTALAEAILSVISQDTALTQTFGTNARMLAEHELSWEKIVDKLETLYARLLRN